MVSENRIAFVELAEKDNTNRVAFSASFSGLIFLKSSRNLDLKNYRYRHSLKLIPRGGFWVF